MFCIFRSFVCHCAVEVVVVGLIVRDHVPPGLRRVRVKGCADASLSELSSSRLMTSTMVPCRIRLVSSH